MSGPIARGLTSIITPGTATKVAVDQYGRVTILGSLVASDIPNLPASIITSGQLAVARGGSGADLSLTGGANQIVRQNSVGGAFTVSALGSADIPWSTPGTIGSVTPNTGVFTTVSIGGPAVTELTVFTTSASDPRGIMSGQYSDDALGSRIHLRKARGTIAAPTTIVTGDVLGRIRFSGYDGANFLQMASIDGISTGTVANTRVPTYLSFSVATDAVPSVLTEVARLTTTGLNNAAVGATTPNTGAFTNLTVTGGGYIKPSADSTTALLITKADGTTGIARIDSTNGRFAFGVGTPLNTVHIFSADAATLGLQGPRPTVSWYDSTGTLAASIDTVVDPIGVNRGLEFRTPDVSGATGSADNFHMMRFNGSTNKLYFGDNGSIGMLQSGHSLWINGGIGSNPINGLGPQLALIKGSTNSLATIGINTYLPQAALDVVGADLLNTSYALKLKTTSAELITNVVDRDFSGAGNWTGINWSIVSAAFKHTTGATTAATLAAANLTSGQLAANNIYRVTFTISGATAGTVVPKLGNVGTGGIAVGANTTYTQYLLLSGAPFDLTFTPTSTFDGSLDNISVLRLADIVTVDNSGAVGIFAPASGTWLSIGRQPTTAYFVFSNEGLSLATISTGSSNFGLINFASSTVVNRGSSSGAYSTAINLLPTISPVSGSDANYAVTISPTVNQTSTSTGDISMIRINPTYTSVLGTLRLLDFTIGSSGARVTEVTRTGLVSLTPIDAVTNASTTVLTLGHYLTTASPAAAGIASSLLFKVADNASAIGAGINVAGIEAQLTDTTHATAKSRTDFTAYDNVASASVRRVVVSIGANSGAGLLSFFNNALVIQQVDGAGLTNNVTVGGTTNQIDDFVGTLYATDAATIRNDIYQLARKQKIIDDALRLYGLLT